MKIVVTGASGFIGSAVTRALRARHVDVAAVSRRPPQQAGAVQVSHYSQAPPGDVLIHLAEVRDRQQSGHHEAAALAQLDALLAKGYPKAIYVSSALVYGEHSTRAHAESDPPQPSDAYTRLKLRCEVRTLEAAGVVLRISNVYGPGMASTNVVSRVLGQLAGEGPLEVLDEKPQRDFVWIDDVGEALALVAERASGPLVLNIGSGIATSVGNLARLALRVAGRPERRVLSTRPAGRPSCVVLDPSAAQQRIGWRVTTSLEAGLRQLVSVGRAVA